MEMTMTMTRIAGLSAAMLLGLTLFSGSPYAASGSDDAAGMDSIEPATGSHTLEWGPNSADVELIAFQQCRAACAPQCGSISNANDSEHCQMSCEMKCNQATPATVTK